MLLPAGNCVTEIGSYFCKFRQQGANLFFYIVRFHRLCCKNAGHGRFWSFLKSGKKKKQFLYQGENFNLVFFCTDLMR